MPRRLDPRLYLAIPLVPKVIALVATAGIGVAFASPDVLPLTSIRDLEWVGEAWISLKAAGILGSIVLVLILRRQIRITDDQAKRYQAEIAARDSLIVELRKEHDAHLERSLVINATVNATLGAQAAVMERLISSNRELVEWIKTQIMDLFRKSGMEPPPIPPAAHRQTPR